jgi:hypothetical protein
MTENSNTKEDITAPLQLDQTTRPTPGTMLSVCELPLVNHACGMAANGEQRACCIDSASLPFGLEASGSQPCRTIRLLLFRTRQPPGAARCDAIN